MYHLSPYIHRISLGYLFLSQVLNISSTSCFSKTFRSSGSWMRVMAICSLGFGMSVSSVSASSALASLASLNTSSTKATAAPVCNRPRRRKAEMVPGTGLMNGRTWRVRNVFLSRLNRLHLVDKGCGRTTASRSSPGHVSFKKERRTPRRWSSSCPCRPPKVADSA